MYRLTHKDFSCLYNMMESVNKVKQYTEKFNSADEFYNNSISFDAAMMNFIVIGEMVDKLSDDFFNNCSTSFDWQKVKSFRNIIAHNYFGIDAEEVWQIIQTSLNDLKIELENLLETK